LTALQLHTEQSFWWGSITVSQILTAITALCAALLTVVGNVENFLNLGAQAAGFREARDLLLSRFREYYSKWVYHVDAYGKTPTPCMNAGRLYRQLVDSDQELRQKLKQLTEIQPRQPGGKPSTAGQD